MNPPSAEWIVFPAAFAAAVVLTSLLRRYALARRLVDVPNERSSHDVPTPRGGGVAIVLSFLAGLPVLAGAGLVAYPTMVGLVTGGAIVAAIGFVDDRGHVAARWRLLGHLVAAAWVLAWLGGIPGLPIFGRPVTWGWFGLALVVLYLVWLLNLYNFMDGIDGIAAMEAATVCLGGALLHWLVAPQSNGWAAPLLLLFSVLGFLVWNYPPAKIFMGDAGSGFLGFALGVLSIDAAWKVPDLFWSWVILLGAFVVDATVTLFRRIWRREKLYVAHRSHAYQYASRVYKSHQAVTLAVVLMNLAWLLPIALLVGRGTLDGVFGVAIAYAPLVWLAYRYKAGARELQER